MGDARNRFFVPIAQSTERECPKLQVAGESPAGDTISSGCCSRVRIRPCQGRGDGATPSTRSNFRGCSSSAERSFDMREARRAALLVPIIFEGIAQPARADASHASGRKCKSFCSHHFSPCGVAQPNTPASHAGDHRSEAGQGRQFHRRVVHGE